MATQSKLIFKQYNLNIPLDFVIIVGGYEIHVHLAKHLFKSRKGQTRPRAFMFKALWQYEELIKHAFTKNNIAEYANEGRVAYIFKYLKNDYGILFDIRLRDGVYDVTVITIDMKDSRHFLVGGMFMKEKNKIYSDFSLPISYMRQIKKRISRNSKYEFYHTFLFDANKYFNEYRKQVEEERVAQALSSRISAGDMDFSIYWLKVYIGNSKSVYIKTSIEKVWRGGREVTVIIFADFKMSRKAMNQMNLGTENIYKLGDVASNFHFGNTPKEKLNRSGLKIKSKGACKINCFKISCNSFSVFPRDIS